MAEKERSFGIVAFLDILGFGDKVVKAVEDDAFEVVVEKICKVQHEFEIESDDQWVREIHTSMKKTVLAFSDSVVMHVPIRSQMAELTGEFDLIMSEMESLAWAQWNCVIDGLFLRGGVDLGWWYQRGATLVSQGLVRAYKAENGANVPVIALTDDLYQFLAAHQDCGQSTTDGDPLRIFRELRIPGQADHDSGLMAIAIPG